MVLVANARNIPHLTRLMRRVNAKATEASLGMNHKQVFMLSSLRDQGELPQTTLCDMMRLTQNTVVAWLNELEDAGYVAVPGGWRSPAWIAVERHVVAA